MKRPEIAGSEARQPTFWRSPRLRSSVPSETIKIPPPSRLPNEPGSLLMTLLPMGITVGALIGVAFVMGSLDSGGTPTWLLFTLPMLLASSAATVVTRGLQARQRKKEAVRREEVYRAYLESLASRLGQAAEVQRKATVRENPAPADCLTIVQKRQRQLWARRPGDDDYCDFRVGTGSQPSLVLSAEAPEQPDPLDPDPLIRKAAKLQGEFALVHDVPICIKLKEAGVVGLAGPVEDRMGLARAVIAQLTTHHAPTELRLAVVAPASPERWSWVRWLPHLHDGDGQRYLALDQAAVSSLARRIGETLDARTRRLDDGGNVLSAIVPTLVLVLDSADVMVLEPEFQRVLSDGPRYGMYAIVVDGAVRRLPQACAVNVRVGQDDPFISYGEPSGQRDERFQPDELSAELAEAHALALAPIRLLQPATVEDLPEVVSFLDMLGCDRVGDLAIDEQWERSLPPSRTIEAPIGLGAGSEVVSLDLHERAHGPNGLVAGMVGTGKSELLQTLVASLAVRYHPHRVAFVLIDYKGGGMARPLAALPHTLGTITNLQEGNLAERAITSLTAESERRQRLFADADVTHIDAYQDLFVRGIVKEPLPYLVIIVDEFAEMKTERPEIAKEFISIARLGRAQGFRLILAMQKPAGIVDGQIEANTRFRICLRVAQPEDSSAMLRCPDAAYLEGIGRAYFQVGMNEVFQQFQVGWGGAPYDPEALVADDPLEIAEVLPDGRRVSLLRPGRSSSTAPGATQLQAVVQAIVETAMRMDLPLAERPWRDDLPNQLSLDEVRPGEDGWDGSTWRPISRWLFPFIGKLDDPAHQRQPLLQMPLAKEYHLAVYGAPGYGKTVLLQTMVASLCMDHPPSDLNVYVLDFGGRFLKALEAFPHVGSVLTPVDEEAVERLFQSLQRAVADRQELFSSVGAADLLEYRSLGNQLPGLVLVIDNFAALTATFEWAQDAVAQLVRDGGNLGIHVVFTAGSVSDVRYKVLTGITLSAALRLADKGEYSPIVGRMGKEPPAIPGRGVLSTVGGIFQCAGSLAGEPDSQRMAALSRLASGMAGAWAGESAPPVQTLPAVLPLSAVLGKESSDHGESPEAPVGWRTSDLSSLSVSLRRTPHLVVSGPRGCGRSTLLSTLALGLAATLPPDRLWLYVLDSGRRSLSGLAGLPHVRAYSTSPEQAGNALQDVDAFAGERIQDGWGGVGAEIVIMVDDYADPFDRPVAPGAADTLDRLLHRGDRAGLHLVVASSTMDWRSVQFSDPLARALVGGGTGFEFGSRDSAVLELRHVLGQRQLAPSPGLAYWADRGQPTLMRVATPDADEGGLPGWVDAIAQRWGAAGSDTATDSRGTILVEE